MTEFGVAPFAVAESQDPPAAVAVKLIPAVPVTFTVWAGGVVPPVWKAKLSDVVLRFKVGPTTTIVTGMVAEVAPGAETVTEPLNVPGVVKPEVTTETLIDEGTVPPDVAASHELGPELVDTDVVYTSPDVPVILTGCAVGAVPPIV